MIVLGWGSGAKELGAGFVTTCTNCNNTSPFIVVESSKKFTLYWVPVAKWSKKYFYICPVCSNGFEVPTIELAQRIIASAFRNPTEPDSKLIRDLQAAMDLEGLGQDTKGAEERAAAARRAEEERERRASEERGAAAHMTLQECFRILEVEPGSSWENIKKAYRLQISIWHPDRFETNTPLYAKVSERTKAINAAYSLLEEVERGKRAAEEREAVARRAEEERARRAEEERLAAARRAEDERARKAAEERAAVARREQEERAQKAAEERAAGARQVDNERASKASEERALVARRAEEQIRVLHAEADVAACSAKLQPRSSAATIAIFIALFALGLVIVLASQGVVSRRATVAAAIPRDTPSLSQKEPITEAPEHTLSLKASGGSPELPRTNELAAKTRSDLDQPPPDPSRTQNSGHQSPFPSSGHSPSEQRFIYRFPAQPEFSAREVQHEILRPEAFRVGVEYFWAERFNLSIESFQQAQRVQPTDAAISYFLALSQFRNGAVEAARKSVRAAVAIERVSPLADYYELMERVQGPMRTWLESQRAIAKKEL